MAEAFRSQLLRDENRVQPCSDQSCMICLTRCDTLNPETGTVEWEVRLPCKHTVGSQCISKWLDPSGTASNACPMCRYVFFDADDLTPAAVLASNDSEPIVTEPTFSGFDSVSESDMSSESEYELDEEEERRRSLVFDQLKAWCETYCQRLDLASSPRVARVTECLAMRIYVFRLLEPCCLTNLAALSVLVGSHLMDMPRSRSEVAMMTEVDDRELLRLYRLFWHSPHRPEIFFDVHFLGMIGRGGPQIVQSYLPEVRDLVSDEEILAMIDRGQTEPVTTDLPLGRE